MTEDSAAPGPSAQTRENGGHSETGPSGERPIALDAFVGCPHCGGPVDVSAPVARTCREVAQIIFDRLNDGETAEQLLHPLELVVFECDDTQRRALLATSPLRLLVPLPGA